MAEAQNIKQSLISGEEQQQLSNGQAVYEMTKTEGWKIVEKWLKDLSFHSWVDPRGTKKSEWEWAELNAFHASNNAAELLDAIQKTINDAEYLDKVKRGEVSRGRPMKI